MSSEESSDDEGDTLALDLWFKWAKTQADLWPLPGSPPTSAILLDADGPWGASACGVEIRLCADNAAKGRGAFAVRRLRAGDIVGVYHGEQLTQREYAIRHGKLAPITPDEAREQDERRARILALDPLVDQPQGGLENHGAYVLSLLPETSATVKKFIDGEDDLNDEHVSCIDAEDPSRSSWCRFINHAPTDSKAAGKRKKHRAIPPSAVKAGGKRKRAENDKANLLLRINPQQALVWFEASRDIATNEELFFDYGAEYEWE